MHASVAADVVEVAGELEGDVRARARDAARDGARQGPRGRAGARRARGRLALRPGRLRRGAARTGPRPTAAPARRRSPGREAARAGRAARLRAARRRRGGDPRRRRARGGRPGRPQLPRQPALRREARRRRAPRAVVVAPGARDDAARLVSDNPYLAFARAVALVRPRAAPGPGRPRLGAGGPDARSSARACTSGALAVVGAGVRLGARSVLHPHVVLYDGVEVGEDCVLHSGVHVRERCRLGNRVVVQNGAVIGADGFGFARDARGPLPQVPAGRDRGGRGRRRDRRPHRDRPRGARRDPHRPRARSSTTWCRSATRSRSARTRARRPGRHRRQHADRPPRHARRARWASPATSRSATASSRRPRAGIPGSLETGAVVSGSPAIENRAWLKSIAVFAKLPELQRRLRELERKVESLLGSR